MCDITQNIVTAAATGSDVTSPVTVLLRQTTGKHLFSGRLSRCVLTRLDRRGSAPLFSHGDANVNVCSVAQLRRLSHLFPPRSFEAPLTQQEEDSEHVWSRRESL